MRITTQILSQNRYGRTIRSILASLFKQTISQLFFHTLTRSWITDIGNRITLFRQFIRRRQTHWIRQTKASFFRLKGKDIRQRNSSQIISIRGHAIRCIRLTINQLRNFFTRFQKAILVIKMNSLAELITSHGNLLIVTRRYPVCHCRTISTNVEINTCNRRQLIIVPIQKQMCSCHKRFIPNHISRPC